MATRAASRTGLAAGASATLSVTSIAVGCLALTGYRSFRADHQTQIPMLLKRLDPSLFAGDWYFSGDAQFAVREFHLAFAELLFRVLRSIELVLFVEYMLVLCALIAALRALGQRPHQGTGFVVMAVLCVFSMRQFGSFADVDVVEEITVPRIFANLACVWAIPLILKGRYLVAGLLLGALGLFQVAPVVQFLPILLAWIVWMRPSKRGLEGAGLLAAGFGLSSWPQLFLLRRFVESSQQLPMEEVVHWLAFVRHPHLMLPESFPLPDYLEMGALLIFVAALASAERLGTVERSLLRLSAVIGIFLIGLLFFTGVVPIPILVIAQPMRMTGIFRLPLLLLLAAYALRLLRSGGKLDLWRGLLFCFSAYKCNAQPLPMILWLVLEAAVIASRRLLSPAGAHRIAVLATLADTLVWSSTGRFRGIAVALAGALYARAGDPVSALSRWGTSLACSRTARAGPPLCAAAFLVLLVGFPFRAWRERQPSDWSLVERQHYRIARSYQVYPFPDGALERAAWWAREHTPAGSNFAIPPALGDQSFHIWSLRAVVFNMKLFPFSQQEWPEWIDRYYALGGVLDPGAEPERARALRGSRGGKMVGELYAHLPAPTLASVARRYGAEYVISDDALLLDAAEFAPAGGPFFETRHLLRRKRSDPPLYVFRLRSRSLAGPAFGPANAPVPTTALAP